MIAYLKGSILAKEANAVILEVNGIGYEVVISSRLIAELRTGQEIKLFIAENIKDDSYNLYGFTTTEERSMYYRLTAVTGVGPKAAMAILARHATAEIEQAIIGADTTIFSNVSGIGKKTAQRIILELKGKLVQTLDKPTVKDDPVYQALLNLGYSAAQSKEVLSRLPNDLSTEDKIKSALKELALR